LLGGDEQQLAPPMVWHKTERRHHHPWCGGDDNALTWGVIGPQTMVGAEAAGRLISKKRDVSGETEVENRGAKVS